jgi:hypothetical protein
MLKMTNEADHLETAYIVEKGKAAIKLIDHLRVKMFRIDVFPKKIIEVIIARCDDAGSEHGPLTQFCITDEDLITELVSDKKFEDFIDHLEDIAVGSSDPKNKTLKDRFQACPISCAKIKK